MAAQAFFLASFAITARGASSAAAAASFVAGGASFRPGLVLPRLRCSASASGIRSSSSQSQGKVEPPNLEQLCEKARLSLTPEEVADFTPKIASVLDWFSQLQDVDLDNVAPAVRVGELDGESHMRADVPVAFEEGESMLAAAPEREGPYLKVPKILREK